MVFIWGGVILKIRWDDIYKHTLGWRAHEWEFFSSLLFLPSRWSTKWVLKHFLRSLKCVLDLVFLGLECEFVLVLLYLLLSCQWIEKKKGFLRNAGFSSGLRQWNISTFLGRRGVRRLIYGNKCPMNDSYNLDQLMFYDYCETGRTQHSKITGQIGEVQAWTEQKGVSESSWMNSK